MNTLKNKMQVEIWSDVMCPFCYIGKRKFENALAQFQNKEQIEIIWKSFQLAPDMQTDPSKSIHQYLAEHKGIDLQQAKQMNDQVTQLAAKIGLTYDFEKSIVANSFKAHQFAHFAKVHGKQNEAEEKLFKAYFTDGKNIDDINTLMQLGKELALDSDSLKTALENNTYTNNVNEDIYEAQQVGVRGVPFFVFDRKLAVSGAQESSVFLEALEKTFNERKQ